MPSLSRRAVLVASSAALFGAGCIAPDAASEPVHWVTVYLGERDETHDVAVTVTDEGGATLFDEAYGLSDDNEAVEHAPLPASGDPSKLAVTVDGVRFERDWPGFEQPGLPCDGPNRSGVEVWVESAPDGTPSIRVEADCQHVTAD